MIYLILTLDVLLSALLLWLILSAMRFWKRADKPYQYSRDIDPEVSRLLEVDPLDWYLDEHEIAIT